MSGNQVRKKMPFNLLSVRQPQATKSPSAVGSTGPATEKDESDPTHPIFALHSGDTEERKLGLFRKMFSLNGDPSSFKDANHANPDLIKKRSSLVPPNYTPIFQTRCFPLTRINSKYEWAEQLVSVPDNGIRTELSDMYQLFQLMEKRPLVLTSDDIDLFYEWFTTFLVIVEEMFLLEETCLYAWVEKTDELSSEDRKWEAPPNRIIGDLSEARRLKQKGNIMRLGREIKTYKQSFAGRPVLQSLPGLAAIVEPFADELISYLELKKGVLPNCIKSRFNQKDRTRFEKSYWLTARKMEMPAFTVIAATRWMDRREIRQWKTKWFTGPGKGIYGKWKNTFARKHSEVINEFIRRVDESQIERDTQVMMHEIARARVADLPQEEYSELDSFARDSCASSFNNSVGGFIQTVPAVETC